MLELRAWIFTSTAPPHLIFPASVIWRFALVRSAFSKIAAESFELVKVRFPETRFGEVSRHKG